MNPVLPDEAVAFGEAARSAFESLGGVDLARSAENDGEARQRALTALERLGVPDLDVLGDADSLAAAVELCREAGRVVLPAPVTAVCTGGVVAIDAATPVVDHGDLLPEWAGVDVATGVVTAYVADGSRFASRLGPFATAMKATEDATAVDSHLGTAWMVLSGSVLLGVVDRAIELCVDHVRNREQFGQKISEFQAVQFQIADAVTAAKGLRELVHFTAWRLSTDIDASITDALALRVYALDTARSVLRTTQQLHGASGMCDEYDISILVRHAQPYLRLPFGVERSVDVLDAAVRTHGFAGLFPHGGRH